MNDLINNFENSKQKENDIEFWYGRDLQKLLEYTRWENFNSLIEKSKKSCQDDIENHFHQLVKMVPIGSETKREIQDYKLTRYACYLIAMNGDPKKEDDTICTELFCYSNKETRIRRR